MRVAVLKLSRINGFEAVVPTTPAADERLPLPCHLSRPLRADLASFAFGYIPRFCQR